MAVSRTTDGWTYVTPSGDSRIIYVSSSIGNDANDGSGARPVKTLWKAVSLTRPFMPDQILLKRGDTWTETLEPLNSGRGPSEPAFVGSYGTGAKPIIRIPNEALDISAKSNIVVTDLQLVGPSNGEDGVGFTVWGATKNLLLENIRVTGFGFGGVIQPLNGRAADVTIRRCVVHENWQPGMSQGVYIEGVDRLTLEENVFDYNGWREGVKAPTMFLHNVYVQDDPTDGSQPVRQLVVRNNISTRAAAQGFKLAPSDASVVTGNLCAQCAIGIWSGQTGGTVEGNTIVHGIWRDEVIPGWGMTGRLNGAIVRDNLVAHVTYPPNGYSVAYDVGGSTSVWSGNAAWNWPNADGKPANKTSGFPDPTHNLTTYAQVMGYADIFAELQAQERGAYDERLTAAAVCAWIRAGYGFGDAPPPPPPPPPPVEVNIDSLVVRRTDGTTQVFKPYKPPAKAAAIKQINVVYSDGTIAEPFKAS